MKKFLCILFVAGFLSMNLMAKEVNVKAKGKVIETGKLPYLTLVDKFNYNTNDYDKKLSTQMSLTINKAWLGGYNLEDIKTIELRNDSNRLIIIYTFKRRDSGLLENEYDYNELNNTDNQENNDPD